MTKVEMFEFIKEEFTKRGFIANPKGETYKRSLYNPETKIHIHIGNIGTVSAGIQVVDMVDNGLTWGKAYHKLPNGTEIRFNFRDKTFDEFFKVTYTNRVNKLNKILEEMK
jgi:hypothetical protein